MISTPTKSSNYREVLGVVRAAHPRAVKTTDVLAALPDLPCDARPQVKRNRVWRALLMAERLRAVRRCGTVTVPAPCGGFIRVMTSTYVGEADNLLLGRVAIPGPRLTQGG